MVVKRGYKQAEVGVVPEDWDVVLLDSVAKRGSGHTPDKAHPEYWGGEIKWISLQDSDRLDRLYISDTAAKITPVGIANSSARLHPAGTVVLSRDAGVGKSAIMKLDMAVSQHFMAWTCKPLLYNLFLYYWLRKEKPEFERIAMGSTIKTIGLSYFRQLVVPLPTKAEQEAIAEALSDADAFIESLEQLVAKKRQLKQGAMQELLTGKRRLPGFEVKCGYKQTEVGVIPMDWEVAPVGLHLRRKPSYGINAPAVSFDSRLPTYLRITDITDDGRFLTAGKASVEHPAAAAYLLQPGDVVFARTGASVGKSYLYNPEDGDLVFAGFLIRLSPNPERLVPGFLSFYAQSCPYWNWVKVNSMRSGQPGINGREYASLPICLPPTKAEQEAVSGALSDMEAEIIALEAKLVKASQIKQGMIQELLTGRIRLV